MQAINFKKVLLLLFYFYTAGNLCFAQTVIVNSGGSIQTAVNNAVAGTTIQVTAGTYSEKILFSSKNGTAGNFITLKADPGVILSGTNSSGNNLTPSGREGLITIFNSSYIKIDGFDIQNFITGGGATPVGIYINGSGSNIQILNNKVHNIRNNSTCKDPCGEGAHGIAVFGTTSAGITDILIQGNEVYANILEASEAMVLNGNVERFKILSNNVHDNNNIGFDFIGYENECSGCGANDRVRNGLVQNNISKNNSTKTNPWYSNKPSCGGFYVDGGSLIVFDRNTSTGNDIGFEFASEHAGKSTDDIVMTNNFVYGNSDGGLSCGGSESNLGAANRIQVHNNSFYQNKGFGTEITFQYKVTNSLFTNNIFYGKATAAESYASSGTGSTGNTWGKNIWWGTSTASNGLPGTLVIQNPLYISPATGDLKIQATSPAVNTGATSANITTWASTFWDGIYPPNGDIPANGLLDINSEPRLVGTIDLGADEYGTGGGATIPTAPSGLTAVANSSSQITLNWTDNSTDETGFQVERSLTSGSGFALVTTTASNIVSFVNTGLTASTTYYYRIRSTNSAGSSAYTAVISATTQAAVTIPTAPSGLTAVANSSSQITLNWTDNSTDETGFQVERSLTSGSGFALVTTAASNIVSFVNTGLSASTTYYYRIRSTNSAGSSAYTATVSATTQAAAVTIPIAPSGLAATANSSSQITLNWTDNSNNETGFQVERSLTSGSGFTLLSTTAANIISFANTGLTASTTYYYRIRSTNSAGSSAYTAVVSATTQSAGGTITIVIDGNTADWAAVSTIATAGTGGMTSLKAYSDATNLYILAQGTTNTNYSFYINTDNNTATGFTAGGLWNPEGNEYTLENGVLNKYNGTGTNWSWTTSGVTQTGIQAVKNASAIEVKIPKTNITGLGTTIKIGVDIESASWNNVGAIPALNTAEATYVLGASLAAKAGGYSSESATGNTFDIHFYPNPAKESVSISFNSKKNNTYFTVDIYTQDGKRVKSFSEKNIGFGKQERLFNVASLLNGIYILKFRLGEEQLFSSQLLIAN